MTMKASVLTVFLCTIFGANAVAIKICLTGIGAFTTAGIRFALAAIAIVLWAKYKKIPIKLNNKQLSQMLILTIVFVVQVSCFYHGLDKTTASHGVLITNLLPFLILGLAHFFIPGDSITFKKTAGITLGFIGVLILFFDKQDLAGNLRTGDFIVLTAVFLWSINAVFIKRIIADYSAIQITLYPMVFGSPFLFLGGILWDDQMISQINPAIVSSLLYQSVITTSFGFVTWNLLLQKFGATSLHSFVFIMPLTGVLFGVLLLKESVTPYLLASLIFIITGVIVVNLRRKASQHQR